MTEEPVQVFMTQRQWDSLDKLTTEHDWVYNVVQLDQDGEIVRTIARYIWDDTLGEFVVEE